MRCRIHFERVFVLNPAGDKVTAEDDGAQAAQHNSNGLKGTSISMAFLLQQTVHAISNFIPESVKKIRSSYSRRLRDQVVLAIRVSRATSDFRD